MPKQTWIWGIHTQACRILKRHCLLLARSWQHAEPQPSIILISMLARQRSNVAVRAQTEGKKCGLCLTMADQILPWISHAQAQGIASLSLYMEGSQSLC